MNNWISVNDSHPPLNLLVLFYYEDGAIRIGEYWTILEKHCFSFETSHGKVTHWQSLPEPPEVK